MRVAACPTTASNARWSLKIVLLSIMLFQLEMIWNFCLMVQVGREPTSIVWGFGWRLWDYESDRMARYNCEMNDLQITRRYGYCIVCWVLISNSFKGWRALVCFLSKRLHAVAHTSHEGTVMNPARFRGRTCRAILEVDSRWVYNVFLLLTVTLWCSLKRPMPNMKLFHCNTEIGWPNVTRSITIFTKHLHMFFATSCEPPWTSWCPGDNDVVVVVVVAIETWICDDSTKLWI